MKNAKYKRKIYLKDKPREEALHELLHNFSPKRKIEKIPSMECVRTSDSSNRFLRKCRVPIIMPQRWMELL